MPYYVELSRNPLVMRRDGKQFLTRTERIFVKIASSWSEAKKYAKQHGGKAFVSGQEIKEAFTPEDVPKGPEAKEIAMRTKLLRGLASLLILLAVASAARAELATDPQTSLTSAAASLTAPFDLTSDASGASRISFARLHNINGISPDDVLGSVPQISAHIAFWDGDSCSHLADVNVCLTLNSTYVIDFTNVSSAIFDPTVGPIAVGTPANLTGKRGFLTATAYATNRDCAPGRSTGDVLVDQALAGQWSISDVASSATFNGNMLGHGLDPTGKFVALPSGNLDSINIGVYAPTSVDVSLAIGIALEQNKGRQPGELGPIDGTISADPTFYSPDEQALSLPTIETSCTFFADLQPQFEGDPIGAITRSGFFHISNFSFTNATDEKGLVGGSTQTFVYAISNQALGEFGNTDQGYYTTSIEVLPTPTPTPEPTPAPSATASPTVAPTATPDVTPAPTAEPTATPEAI